MAKRQNERGLFGVYYSKNIFILSKFLKHIFYTENPLYNVKIIKYNINNTVIDNIVYILIIRSICRDISDMRVSRKH